MKQIYIADDNAEFAEFVTAVALRKGWQPVQCVNGLDLVDRVSSGSGSALLIVDINMPQMDGIEAIEGLAIVERPLRLRFITGGANAPLMAARMIAEARGLSVGRNIYKPLRKTDLDDLLDEEGRALEV